MLWPGGTEGTQLYVHVLLLPSLLTGTTAFLIFEKDSILSTRLGTSTSATGYKQFYSQYQLSLRHGSQQFPFMSLGLQCLPKAHIALLEGDGLFKRWHLVGSLQVTGDKPRMVGSQPLPFPLPATRAVVLLCHLATGPITETSETVSQNERF